jgi:SNF2 family DNA or RNA helicase
MTFNGTLKPYQVEAVDRMVTRKKMLVAYEMGLGKTCMTIAAVEKLKDEGSITKPVLVIALSSLKYQWEKEIKKFSDSGTCVIDGAKSVRSVRWMRDMEWEDHTDYVICNYETIVADWDLIKDYEWGAVICDEATAIKGFRSKRSKAVKKLASKVPIRFALTGTPIENGRPEEVYSIMQFVDDTLLGRFDLFDQTFIVRNHFGGVQRYRNLPVFHEKMKQASVRKIQTDPDVAPYLPDTIYRDPILLGFDKKTSQLYNFIADELNNELIEAQQLLGSSFSLFAHYGHESKPGSPADMMRGSIMSKITALRMLCDHPILLEKSAQLFDEQQGSGSAYASSLKARGLLDGVTKSQKLQELKAYVTDHLDTDPDAKVVIFTSWVGMLELIHEELGGTLYTGNMNAKEKEASKEKFLTDPECRVFISSDAGGYGVDLPNANLLVNYDLPWSAGLAVQRNGRIKRASSRWPSITIQDIIVANSIEERQHDMLQQKNAVADAVMDGQGINSKGGVDLTVGSLIGFLQKARP